MPHLQSKQNGFIGTLILLVILGGGAFVLWRIWEASQINFETGVASEIAASSSIVASPTTIPVGYVGYATEDLPIQLAVPENWTIEEAEQLDFRRLPGNIKFTPPEETVDIVLSWGPKKFESTDEYIDALDNARALGKLRSTPNEMLIASEVVASQFVLNYREVDYQITYFVYGDYEYRLEVNATKYKQDSGARNIYQQMLRSIALPSSSTE